MHDIPNPRDAGPEAVGQQRPPEQGKKPVAKFVGINLEVWAIVIVLFVIFIAVILYYAL